MTRELRRALTAMSVAKEELESRIADGRPIAESNRRDLKSHLREIAAMALEMQRLEDDVPAYPPFDPDGGGGTDEHGGRGDR